MCKHITHTYEKHPLYLRHCHRLLLHPFFFLVHQDQVVLLHTQSFHYVIYNSYEDRLNGEFAMIPIRFGENICLLRESEMSFTIHGTHDPIAKPID